MKNATVRRLITRSLVTVLVLGLAAPAFASDDIDFRSSIKKVVAAAPQNVAPQAAPAENPYKTGSLVMIGAGLAIAAYGFTHTTGAKIDTSVDDNFNASASVKETKATGIGLAGLGIAAAGGVVYAMGQKKARSMQPQISFGLDHARVGGTVRW